MKKLISLLAIIGIIFSSCNGRYTIAKRKYNKGFYVNRTNGHSNRTETGIAGRSLKTNEPEKKQSTTIAPELKQDVLAVNAMNQNQKEARESNNSESNAPKKGSSKTTVTTAGSESIAKGHPLASADNKPFIASKQFKAVDVLAESGGSANTKMILLIILAIFIAPLAMFLWDGKTDKWFILDLILYIAAYVGFFIIGSLGGLFGLAAFVIALLRILGKL